MALRPFLHTSTGKAAGGVSRRRITRLLPWLLLGVGLCSASSVLAKSHEGRQDYGALINYIQMENRDGPLVEFKQTGQDVDQTLHRENRHYISQNAALLDRMRAELDSHKLHWQLRKATQRLMVVPEAHPEYAALFEAYCRTAVDFVLEKTQLPNPYDAIATLDSPPEQPLLSGHKGITAYLVHNIADVYTEEYIFFGDRNQDRKISIKLDNRSYLGEIGSYSSHLVIEGAQRFSFERNAYTLWRNSAKNPLNVFIAPVEETLHIALRGATENAIRARLNEKPPETLAAIEAVADEWLAVEEAVVGGLVNELMPVILTRFLDADTSADLVRSLEERQAFTQYRYLNQGIALVDRLGMQSAIHIYQNQPRRFKSLLIDPAPAPTDGPVEAAEDHPSHAPSV